jgi:hypothetical protein
LHFASASEVQVAPTKRNADSVPRPGQRASRRVKKTDAAPTARSVAEEAAQIYPDTFETAPTPDEIAAEAYAIYCARGCAEGSDLDDWFEAERRLSARRMSRRTGAG